MRVHAWRRGRPGASDTGSVPGHAAPVVRRAVRTVADGRAETSGRTGSERRRHRGRHGGRPHPLHRWRRPPCLRPIGARSFERRYQSERRVPNGRHSVASRRGRVNQQLAGRLLIRPPAKSFPQGVVEQSCPSRPIARPARRRRSRTHAPCQAGCRLAMARKGLRGPGAPPAIGP